MSDNHENFIHKGEYVLNKDTNALAKDSLDAVNNPKHYTEFSNGAEVIDITENLNFNRGNAVKYLARAGAKDPAKTIEDLRKAAWYVAREIERLKKEGK